MPGTVYRAGPRLQGGVEPRRRLSKYLKAIMTNAHHNVAARRDVVGPRSDLSGGIGIETVEVRSEPRDQAALLLLHSRIHPIKRGVGQ